jgi:hypothetical protein
VLLSCAGLALATDTFSRPARWEIPAGYHGWLGIRFEEPACSPLLTRRLTEVIVFDQAGRACTSTRAAKGWHSVTYVYVHSDGTRTEVPEGEKGRPGVQIWELVSSGDGKRECGFVGTEEEWHAASPPVPCLSP